MGNAQVSAETKQKIDSLSLEELAYQINKGRTSDFQNDNFAYVVTRHQILTAQEEEQHKQKTLEVAQEANIIAG